MRNLHLLILVSVLNHVAFAGSRVAVALYAISLHASPFTVGVLMALYALLPMLFAVTVGRLTDRIGVRRPMLAGTVALAASTLVPWLWPGLTALYFTSTLIGTSFMLYHISAQNIIGYMGKPEDRAMNFSLLALGFSVSGFTGPMLAGFAIDLAGFMPTFLVLAAFPLAPLVLLALGKPRFPRPPAPRVADHANRGIVGLLREAKLRRVFIVSGLLSMAWDMFAFAIPIYGSRIGLSASRIGLILGSFSAATFAIRVALPALSRRVTAWPLLTGSLIASGATFFLFPLLHDATLLMGLAFLLGLGLGCSQPMVMSLLHTTAPEGRVGEAVGIRIMLVNMSQTGMPLLFGALGAALGMAPVFWATAVLLGAGGYYSGRRAPASSR
ncbi:MAG: MFS transporter [Burkholderiales bacterium]